MNVQLYVQYPDTTEWVLLDLFQEQPIRMNFSVSNIVDPLQVSSIFSRTFRVPHTNVNGPFFRAVFNVNSVSYNATKKAAAYINDNGAFFSIGNIRLNSIYRTEATSNIEYEIIFYGETSDFGSKIGGGFLSEVDLSAYNHDQTYANITNSWTGGLFNGDIVYPLCEWGYTYTGGVPDQATLAVGGARGFVGPSADPLLQSQFKPAIRAKALWDAIFDETGYSYISTFLNGTDFGNLYIVSDSTARAELNVDNTFEAQNGMQNITTGTCAFVEAVTEVSDPGDNFNGVSIYTAKAAGLYQFTVTGTQWGTPPPGGGSYTFYWTLVMKDADTGATLVGSSPFSAGSGYNAPFTRNFTVSLAANQRITFEYCVAALGGPLQFITKLLNITMMCTSAPETVNMASLMPNNIKKIDFVRSIINRYRLVFVPSQENPRRFTITPWKDWILQGSSKDWTEKLDGSKDMKISPLFFGQERFQIYRDIEDADFVNLNYGLVTKQTYGQLNKDSDNELITGTKETVTQFAPTPLFPIGNADATADPMTDPYEYYASRFLVPHFAKDTNTERLPIQPKLRLLYYNGLINVPDATQNWKLLNDSNVQITQTKYPLMSEYNQWPPTTSSFDLSWENEDPLWETELSLNPVARTSYDTFNVYWKGWYETIFDPYSRIVEATFVLHYDDIFDLKFNDYIFVIDAWYIVNKISDYVTGETSACKVELIKVGNSIGLTIPPTVVTYTPIQLCVGATACEAFCCTTIEGPQTFYIDGDNLSEANFIYEDPYGDLPAAPRIYSDGASVTVGVGAEGAISVVYDTSGCDCSLTAYDFEVCYSTVEEGLCVACCCTGDTVTVWGSNSDFTLNAFLYEDSGLTNPAPRGNYNIADAPYSLFVDGLLGQVYAIGLCDSCECDLPEYYELEADFVSDEFAPCAACEETGTPVTVYGDAISWADSTEIYEDINGLNPGDAGNYYDPVGDTVFAVNSSGVITSATYCPACGVDPDAQDFIDAAGITDPTQQDAINQLVIELKAEGLWSKMYAFYPFVGGSAENHKWNLMNPLDTDAAFRLSFSSGWTHSTNGVTPNGSSAYADTYLFPSVTLTTNDTHISVYSRTDSALADATDIGALGTTPGIYLPALWLRVKNSSDGNLNSYQYDYTSATRVDVTNAVATGHYIGNRNSNVNHNVWKNGVEIGSSATAETLDVTNIINSIYIGAGNVTGGAAQFSNRQLAAATIGQGLTDGEALALYNAIQTFQTTLGRQV